MLSVLAQILCWIKQFGAMMLRALVGFVNLLLDGTFALANAVIAAWPIGMPTMPAMPSQLAEAFGWVAWSPIPVQAILSLLTFLVSVWFLVWIGGPLLKWLKVLD